MAIASIRSSELALQWLGELYPSPLVDLGVHRSDARCIGEGSPKREPCRKLLLSFIEQRSANAFALGVWRDKKLIENALRRDGRK